MTWIHRLKSHFLHSLAISQRNKIRRHLTDALSRLDDQSLARIGLSRCQIAKHASAAAHRAIVVPLKPKPKPNRKSLMMRLRSWRDRQATIRELSTLNDRLLRDIGIEPDQIIDAVDAMLHRRRDLETIDTARHSFCSGRRTSAPEQQESHVSAMVVPGSCKQLHREAARPSTQNGSPAPAHPERRPQASGGPDQRSSRAGALVS
jgi:uncharacterized protein YjiS (DUF1127 family)